MSELAQREAWNRSMLQSLKLPISREARSQIGRQVQLNEEAIAWFREVRGDHEKVIDVHEIVI